jgi:hypothetical protein
VYLTIHINLYHKIKKLEIAFKKKKYINITDLLTDFDIKNNEKYAGKKVASFIKLKYIFNYTHGIIFISARRNRRSLLKLTQEVLEQSS